MQKQNNSSLIYGKIDLSETINHSPERNCHSIIIPYKQLSLADIFNDCQNTFDNDKYEFLELLHQTIDLDEIVPASFISHFYTATGTPRVYQLYPILKTLLLQRISSIPTETLLLVFLNYSQELRDFCGLAIVSDASKITRFMPDFMVDLQSMSHHLVGLAEPICQAIDSSLASMALFDTSLWLHAF